jgi:hypothetical protein
MKKKIYTIILLLGLGGLFGTSCSDMLDQSPDNILTNEEVFKDWNMVQSVLANYYGRVKWGQRIDDDWQYIYLDEACNSSGGRIIPKTLAMRTGVFSITG